MYFVCDGAHALFACLPRKTVVVFSDLFHFIFAALHCAHAHVLQTLSL